MIFFLFLKVLLEGNPELIDTIDNDMMTPLHLACIKGKVDVCKTLVSVKYELLVIKSDNVV